MNFPDVGPDKWYTKYIEQVSDAGYMMGDDEGNFRPNSPLTRAEAATIIARLLDRLNNKPQG